MCREVEGTSTDFWVSFARGAGRGTCVAIFPPLTETLPLAHMNPLRHDGSIDETLCPVSPVAWFCGCLNSSRLNASPEFAQAPPLESISPTGILAAYQCQLGVNPYFLPKTLHDKAGMAAWVVASEPKQPACRISRRSGPPPVPLLVIVCKMVVGMEPSLNSCPQPSVALNLTPRP